MSTICVIKDYEPLKNHSGYRMIYQRLDRRGKIIATDSVVVQSINFVVGSLIPYTAIKAMQN